jgi:predicted transcriptional regulator
MTPISRAPAGRQVRDAAIAIRTTSELKAALEKLAEAERRTLSAYAEMVLERHVADARKKRPRR